VADWILPRVLGEDDVEKQATSGRGHGPTTLDLKSYSRSGLSGDARLLGWLVRARELEIDVPVRIDTGSSDTGLPESSKYRRLFLNQLSGIVVSTFASSITTQRGEDVLPEVRRDQHELDPGRMLYPGYVTHLSRDEHPRVGPGPALRAVREIDRDGVDFAVQTMLSEDLRLSALPETERGFLVELLWELIINTERHARMDFGDPNTGVRFVSVGVYRRSNSSNSFRDLVGSPTPYVADYLDRLEARRGPQVELVSFTVADSGPGIAATLSGDAAIADGDWSRELEFTRRAFTRTGTRRRDVDPDAGLGLVKALKACRALNGLVAVRSGRTLLQRHYLDAGDLTDELLHRGDALARLGGTAVTVLIPWPDKKSSSRKVARR
jgi:hypothetical protein